MRPSAAFLLAVLASGAGASGAGASAPGGAAHAAPTGANFLPHHAFYDLTLKSSTEQGVLAARGNLTYDIADGCTGWTTSQHLLIHMTDRDGRDVTMVSDYATFETKDGTHLNFHARQMTDSATTEVLDGTAVLDRSGGHGHADYAGPERRRVALPPGTMLPNAHTAAILQAGHAGKRFLSMPLFDGTGADGAQDTFVTIEGWRPPRTEKWSVLSDVPSGRVHVAFFDRDETSEEPDYEIGMRYFDNGVSDDLAMNFGDFVMAGKLTEFEPSRAPRC
jgi:hypothetical protein